ncbi:MAG: proline--tRNA ligase, partial [Thermoplasmata archaeon]
MSGDEEKALPKKSEFSEWYTEVVERADLCDKRYPIKGMNVWRPYGWKIMRNIDNIIRKEMERTGHEEVYFPMLIPVEQFKREADHIKGFFGQVYMVTRAGDEELDIPMILRPTSETAIYPLFSLWVRSHADLPLKVFQIVNTFRYETKHTRAFIRVREIHFFESHTCHRDFEDAERQVREDLDIMAKLMRDLCLPYIVCKRPDWDKFPGAYYSLGVDVFMPSGRTLQVGSIHNYRTNFSEPYNIKYEDEHGEHHYVHQTTYGMSERLVGAVVGIHGDDRGIVLPPKIAPYHGVIVPILSKELKDPIIDVCARVRDSLQNAGYSIILDDRDLRPGNKYYYWEMRGVPIRLEVGPRDYADDTITLSLRHTLERRVVKREKIAEEFGKALAEVESGLMERAKAMLL